MKEESNVSFITKNITVSDWKKTLLLNTNLMLAPALRYKITNRTVIIASTVISQSYLNTEIVKLVMLKGFLNI